MNKTAKKVIRITVNVFGYVFLALCMLLLIFAISSKKDPDGAVTVFGKQMRIVRSDSMAENAEVDVSGFEIGSLPVKTMLFIDVVPEDKAEADAWYEALERGDVLTFRYVYGSQVTITHRIKDIKKNGAGDYDIWLEGDNNAGEYGGMTQIIHTADEASLNYVIGKVTGDSFALGVAVYAMRTPVGITCIIIIPCLIVIALEIFKIVGAFKAEKTEKAEAEKAKQQNEIDELKRQLALLQQTVTPPPPVTNETASEQTETKQEEIATAQEQEPTGTMPKEETEEEQTEAVETETSEPTEEEQTTTGEVIETQNKTDERRLEQ